MIHSHENAFYFLDEKLILYVVEHMIAQGLKKSVEVYALLQFCLYLFYILIKVLFVKGFIQNNYTLLYYWLPINKYIKFKILHFFPTINYLFNNLCHPLDSENFQ